MSGNKQSGACSTSARTADEAKRLLYAFPPCSSGDERGGVRKRMRLEEVDRSWGG